MQRSFQRLCVYCGAAQGTKPEYARDAGALGRTLAAQGITLVYGGGRVGLMGVLADQVLAGGGQAIGIITHELKHREIGHEGLSELRLVKTMHERKQAMADLADGFIALPGGVGTFDELFEILSWMQLGLHELPVGLLNGARFFDPLIGMLQHAHAEGFLRIDPAKALILDDHPERLLDRMRDWPGLGARVWPR
jgi:uncharacterized protein (TIGR00730 family)